MYSKEYFKSLPDDKKFELLEKHYNQAEARGQILSKLQKLVSEKNKALDALNARVSAQAGALARIKGASLLISASISEQVQDGTPVEPGVPTK